MRFLFIILIFLNLHAELKDVYPALQQNHNGFVYTSLGWNGNDTSDRRQKNCTDIVTVTSYNGYADQWKITHNFGSLNNQNPNVCYMSYAVFKKTSTPAPPETCSWATTPPYYNSGLPQSQCNNAHKSGGIGLTYLWNFSWCQADNTCYGRKYSCPKGQYFKYATQQCEEPVFKPNPGCPEGYYKHCSSFGVGGPTSCSCRYTCKSNPSDFYDVQVSCGAEPIDSDYPLTNPDAPNDEPDQGKAPSTYDDHSAKCGTEKLLAQSSCQAPNILSFSCDPKTGTVLKSTCTPPNNPNPDGSAPGDDTKGATTKDIKDLGDNLPKKIKDAFRDYFMDGSENLLSSIGEYTKTQTILQSDSNDKLDAIHASANAGLSLQSDANNKLDGIKSSIDNLKPNTVTEPDYGTYNGASNPTANDLKSDPDGSFQDSIESMASDIASIGTEFTKAKNLVTGNFVPPTFENGTCPTLQGPFGISVSPASIGSNLAPYSPIIAILVYISIMMLTFRSVFYFLSRGN